MYLYASYIMCLFQPPSFPWKSIQLITSFLLFLSFHFSPTTHVSYKNKKQNMLSRYLELFAKWNPNESKS